MKLEILYRWYRYQQVDMVHHRAPLYDLYSLPLTQVFQNLYDTLLVFIVDDLSPLLWREDDVIFAHHLRMC